jgi:hypothetical protein
MRTAGKDDNLGGSGWSHRASAVDSRHGLVHGLETDWTAAELRFGLGPRRVATEALLASTGPPAASLRRTFAACPTPDLRAGELIFD